MDAAPTLVAVPGLGLGAAAWAPTLDAVRGPAGGRLVGDVARLPGYGLRAEPGTSLDPAELARRLLDRLAPPGPVLLLGHSASCQVVAHAAVLAPHRVWGLVLVGPTTDPRAGTWTALTRRWFATAAHEPVRQVPLLVHEYRQTGLGSMLRGMDAARTDPIAPVLAASTSPILLLRGRHDRICPGDWLHRLASAGSGATDRAPRRVVHLPAGGHMVPLTHGELVGQAVTGFLAAGTG
jgi:pimeloyl-ACP methyl ester carboxylesterase